ncbi:MULTISPECIES: hypothetical protein [unclassified Herbaspirillum]|uniref:hypothetical protein n=1 Tax=unclassified Herbaspirillum TaxID=2624150 RepID=UPI00116A3303|nr:MULTISPECIES: hypothetical protein [unclassified Herbaspirillum]MBB5393050.1 hypothetical protein [Herbaspirillum sp. SJZ102]TQK04307.1 hypothetical protein FB599_2859 [Herbaspirillum sp. SJZ130]TQK09908.1 hypothetical protein FB598_2903 [Herbaspirillum sp. SJZ106]
MTDLSIKHDCEELETVLARDMTRLYGPLMSGDDLRNALGILTKEAFRQALVRKTLPVPVFPLENRRGKFALTIDVANWLAAQRAKATQQLNNFEKGKDPMT